MTAEDAIEACAKGCEELAKYKSKVAADALRQAAKQMREMLKVAERDQVFMVQARLGEG